MKKWFITIALLGMPLVAAAQSAPGPTARETLRAFYESYLNAHPGRHPVKLHPAFSKDLQRRMKDNERMCAALDKDEVCAWNADSDPYLAAQDMDGKLDYKSAQVAIREPRPGTLSVDLDLFPAEKATGHVHLVYSMIREDDRWVVDDITYDKDHSIRKDIAAQKRNFPSWPALPAAAPAQ
ncbi:MAG: DUF3828 domain-containing protein [Alphaproteobacteria bacterium]